MSLAYDVIPVTIVTGFLGSGKSTLLADVLQGDAARDTAVLVNEFGAVGLDHLLVGEVNAQTVLLDNGCVCCSIRGELKDALAALFSRRARGEVPPFSRIVLETTGLATPAPIIATLLADPIVRSHYVLNATLTVVDALNASHQHEQHLEWLAQVAVADRILISKTDLSGAPAINALRDTLSRVNPAAQILTRDEIRLNADGSTREHRQEDLLREVLFAPASAAALIRRLGAASGSRLLTGLASSEHTSDKAGGVEHRGTIQSSSIQAFCIEIEEPLDWPVFTLWLTMLLNRHGDNILRVKGLLSIAGSAQPAVLHAVRHMVHPVLHLDAWPDEKIASRIVFITDGLPGVELEASYRRFCQFLDEPVH
jgi:G3E family GTPase